MITSRRAGAAHAGTLGWGRTARRAYRVRGLVLPAFTARHDQERWRGENHDENEVADGDQTRTYPAGTQPVRADRPR